AIVQDPSASDQRTQNLAKALVVPLGAHVEATGPVLIIETFSVHSPSLPSFGNPRLIDDSQSAGAQDFPATLDTLSSDGKLMEFDHNQTIPSQYLLRLLKYLPFAPFDINNQDSKWAVLAFQLIDRFAGYLHWTIRWALRAAADDIDRMEVKR